MRATTEETARHERDICNDLLPTTTVYIAEQIARLLPTSRLKWFLWPLEHVACWTMYRITTTDPAISSRVTVSTDPVDIFIWGLWLYCDYLLKCTHHSSLFGYGIFQTKHLWLKSINNQFSTWSTDAWHSEWVFDESPIDIYATTVKALWLIRQKISTVVSCQNYRTESIKWMICVS